MPRRARQHQTGHRSYEDWQSTQAHDSSNRVTPDS
jgi:hypothetical protein